MLFDNWRHVRIIFVAGFSHGVYTFYMFCILAVVLLHKGTLVLSPKAGNGLLCRADLCDLTYRHCIDRRTMGEGGRHKRTFNNKCQPPKHQSAQLQHHSPAMRLAARSFLRQAFLRALSITLRELTNVPDDSKVIYR